MAGTSGGADGTSGGGALTRRQRILLLVGVFLLLAMVRAWATVESVVIDMRNLGRIESPLHVWIWELTSLAMWIAVMPFLWIAVKRFRPPRVAWPWAVLLHIVTSAVVSVVHVGGMMGLRKLIYAALGETYMLGGSIGETLIYEYRKDASTYLLLVALFAFSQWFLAQAPQPEPARADTLDVPDGAVTHRVPVHEIDAVSAAGNYVELAWGPRTLLHRATLSGVEAELGDAFVRIHRGKLVRRAAIRSVETDRSGDFIVTLASGATLRGSRRYRDGL